ncbi:MAG: dihydrolipoyl dehydrogenase family protein [Candidatus Dormibacteria bacterium]
MDRFDVVILGAGSAGEMLATNLGARRTAVIESGLVGGECPYVACMPSKALLRSAQLRREAADLDSFGAVANAVDVGAGTRAFATAVARRDRICEHREDAEHAAELARAGVTLYRGRGRVVGERSVVVDLQEGGLAQLEFEDLVIATGSRAVVPGIPGLDLVPVWRSDEALSSAELPRRLVVLGGGPVGCELGQVYSSFGSAVTIVESADHLLPGEDRRIGDTLADVLIVQGVTVRTGRQVVSCSSDPGGAVLRLSDGGQISCDRVLLATGRKPQVQGLGLESLGLEVGEGPLAVDTACRVEHVRHVWAAGDVTGIAPFTHTANYQAVIIASNLGGKEAVADYRAVPRVVYTSPPVAAVGLGPDAVRSSGLDIVCVEAGVGTSARAAVDGNTKGLLLLWADRRAGCLIGAAAICRGADEWISEAALAIRAHVPVSVLTDIVHPFPTYSELYDSAYRELRQKLE